MICSKLVTLGWEGKLDSTFKKIFFSGYLWIQINITKEFGVYPVSQPGTDR